MANNHGRRGTTRLAFRALHPHSCSADTVDRYHFNNKTCQLELLKSNIGTQGDASVASPKLSHHFEQSHPLPKTICPLQPYAPLDLVASIRRLYQMSTSTWTTSKWGKTLLVVGLASTQALHHSTILMEIQHVSPFYTEHSQQASGRIRRA
jgi:hypothetical protein